MNSNFIDRVDDVIDLKQFAVIMTVSIAGRLAFAKLIKHWNEGPTKK